MAAVIIEELSRIGHVINRYKVDQFPTTIGRSFDNDIILDDPYISPVHATITEVEGDNIVLNDSSLNGVVREGSATIGSRLELISGQEIVLGRTRLRFYLPDHKIPETRPIKYSVGLAKKMTQPVFLTTILLIFSSLLVTNIMLSAKTVLTFEKGLSEFLIPVIVVVIWAAAWAFVGRLIKHQPQFWTHIVIIVLFFLVSNLFGWLIEIAEFNLLSKTVIDILEVSVFGLLLIWFLTNHLRYSTSLYKVTRLFSASIFALSIVGLYFLNVIMVDDKLLKGPSYSKMIKAPYAKIRKDTSIDSYFDDSESIFNISVDKK